MAKRIQIRRDTAANWASINPVLAQGEQGFEIDTNKIKYGDGSNAWNDLEYFSGVSGLSDSQLQQLANDLIPYLLNP